MQIVSRSVVLDYVAAVFAVGVAGVLTLVIEPLQRTPSTLFVAAVMASAWYGGLGPGLAATLLSTVTLEYFFLAPIYSLEVGLLDGVGLAVFVLVAVLISSLNAARQRLEEALRQQDYRKDRFLVLLAQQLSTSLTAMKESVACTRRRLSDGRQAQQDLQTLTRQIETMMRFTDELGDVAAVGQGRLRLLKTTVDLAQIARLAAEQTRSLISERSQKLTLCLPPQALLLNADPTRLEQIVVNLLSHACRFTEPGGNIWLAVAAEPEHAVLRLRDTGIGFSSTSLPHVFNLVEVENGQGDLRIGLSLVRQLVVLHGGTIDVASAGVNKGSEFVVRIPYGVGQGELAA